MQASPPTVRPCIYERRETMTPETLAKINRFTRREFTEDELYVFSVILCDNDIDRDGERFSDSALDKLCELFVGKTGISDHEPSSANQTARIFDTEVVTDEDHLTRFGGTYRYLRAMAYMVRTEENRDLITQIEGGIRKEVSISCSAAKRTCSVCGAESCAHVKGREYGGKACCHVLDEVTDAYEWSFVAVPAQVSAGVTKRFVSGEDEKQGGGIAADNEELRREICRLAFFSGGREAAEKAAHEAEGLGTEALLGMKKRFDTKTGSTATVLQLEAEEESSSAFSTGNRKEMSGDEYRIGKKPVRPVFGRGGH